MTEDEKRQQKAMLLLEYQEAEENLAHLQEKAKRLSQYLLAVSKWMEDRSHGYSTAGGSEEKVYVTEMGGYVNILTSPEVTKAVDFEDVKSLAVEIKDARTRIQQLSERKKSLGVK